MNAAIGDDLAPSVKPTSADKDRLDAAVAAAKAALAKVIPSGYNDLNDVIIEACGGKDSKGTSRAGYYDPMTATGLQKWAELQMVNAMIAKLKEATAAAKENVYSLKFTSYVVSTDWTTITAEITANGKPDEAHGYYVKAALNDGTAQAVDMRGAYPSWKVEVKSSTLLNALTVETKPQGPGAPAGGSGWVHSGPNWYYYQNGTMLTKKLHPELTRAEYHYLLQVAKLMDRERVFLIVKLFASADMPVQELAKVTVEAAKAGTVTVVSGNVAQSIHLPPCLCREMLSYADRNGIYRGPIFLTKEGVPMSRTYVTSAISDLCGLAKIPREKGNPRALRRLYLANKKAVEDNIALLVEQALDRQLEQEQLTIAWDTETE